MAAMAGDEAIGAATRVDGLIAGRVDEAGRDAQKVAAKGFIVADRARKKADIADVAGDKAIGDVAKALHQLVSRAEELAKAAEGAAESATLASDSARQAAEAAMQKARSGLLAEVF